MSVEESFFNRFSAQPGSLVEQSPQAKAPCSYHKLGRCTRGNQCDFSHELSNNSNNSAQSREWGRNHEPTPVSSHYTVEQGESRLLTSYQSGEPSQGVSSLFSSYFYGAPGQETAERQEVPTANIARPQQLHVQEDLSQSHENSFSGLFTDDSQGVADAMHDLSLLPSDLREEVSDTKRSVRSTRNAQYPRLFERAQGDEKNQSQTRFQPSQQNNMYNYHLRNEARNVSSSPAPTPVPQQHPSRQHGQPQGLSSPLPAPSPSAEWHRQAQPTTRGPSSYSSPLQPASPPHQTASPPTPAKPTSSFAKSLDKIKHIKEFRPRGYYPPYTPHQPQPPPPDSDEPAQPEFQPQSQPQPQQPQQAVYFEGYDENGVPYANDGYFMDQDLSDQVSVLHYDDRKTCLYFLQNNCRYGDHCRFSHSFGRTNRCPNCDHLCLADPLDHQKHIQECQETQLAQEERRFSVNLPCGICMENVVNSGRRFGLLPSCDHVFCLPCIREWRGSADHQQSRETVRACPICRIESYYVVPCDRWLRAGERKQQIMDRYLVRLRQTPCMHFNKGKGTCPFGSSCFYAHIDENGKEVESEKLRVRLNADGEAEVVRKVLLSDFLRK